MRKVTEDEINAYFTAAQQMYKAVATGVFIIMMGVAAMILSSYVFEEMVFIPAMPNIHETVPVVLLLVCIAAAVAFFITSGVRYEKYEYMEKGVEAEPSVREHLTKELEMYAPVNTMLVTIGIVLCILGPAVLLLLRTFLPESNGADIVGISIMLSMFAVAAMLIIVGAGRKEMYEKVLRLKAYEPWREKENKIIGVTASVVWPLAVAVFLVWGICFHGFGISWIVFPIVGVLFGSFAAICSAVLQK